MSIISDVHTPGDWGEHHDYYQHIDDLRQRRALALISHFGTPGGGEKVVFIDDLIVIAAPPDLAGDCDEIDLVVLPLDEFISNFSANIARDADPAALRWVEKIVHWPDLGC